MCSAPTYSQDSEQTSTNGNEKYIGYFIESMSCMVEDRDLGNIIPPTPNPLNLSVSFLMFSSKELTQPLTMIWKELSGLLAMAATFMKSCQTPLRG